jgi:uncharacterized protein (DUF58 family)
MRLYATSAAFQVGLAGASLLVLGIVMRAPPAMAFGAAIITTVAFARAKSAITVTDLRGRGFEMNWALRDRVLRITVNQTVTVQADIRNRSQHVVRAVNVRAIHSSLLDVALEDQEVLLAPEAVTRVVLTVCARRIGRWGLHGLSFEVRDTFAGGDGLFEVPLLFLNPVGIEASPAPLRAMQRSANGGRARRADPSGCASRRRGESSSLHEIRDYRHGDSMRKLAWKASARRGKLLVRETEQEEVQSSFYVLDASVELWAGDPGSAPLDHTVHELAKSIRGAIARGERVGLAIVASRVLAWVELGAGPKHTEAIEQALFAASRCVDSDRCGLRTSELASLVFEHLRPLETTRQNSKANIDSIGLRAEAQLERAPFAAHEPIATTATEARLRKYIEAFGIETPPLEQGERAASEAMIASVLGTLAKERKHIGSVYVFGPFSAASAITRSAVRRVRVSGISIVWALTPFERTLRHADPSVATGARTAAEAATYAVALRVRAADRRNGAALSASGASRLRLAGPSK